VEYWQRLRTLVGHQPLLMPVAAVLIRDGAGRVLLQQRADGRHWGILGGALDLGESPEDAARREVREEAGLEFGALTLVDVYAGPAFSHVYENGDQVSFVMIVYETREMMGQPIADGDESVALAFFPLDALPEDLLPVARHVLDDYRRRQGIAP
jgi:8-oxo-dGTP pyrophosphatase MutT (NUDIX family)